MRTLSPRAPLLEVFASIQGVGRYTGEAQVFLRLAGCPLRCRYCELVLDADRIIESVHGRGAGGLDPGLTVP
jgi:hypothetical protein